MTEHEQLSKERARVRAGYRKRLGRSALQASDGLESAVFENSVDLSPPSVRDRIDSVGAELHRIVKDRLGDSPDLHVQADDILTKGDTALRMLGNDDDGLHENPEFMNALEAIVQTDGSRPSFLIKDGVPDTTSSPVGDWAATLSDNATLLGKAIECVGRVDMGGVLVGTGFLVQESLILTNRHVLQAVANRDMNQVWQFKPDTLIDFGREFQARDSVNPRKLRRVVFSGPKPIDAFSIDHKKLDLVLIELEPLAAGSAHPGVLSVDLSQNWATTDVPVFTVGYPGKPFPGLYTPSVLDLLFEATFGFKRLAPGLIMDPHATLEPWTLVHDATTLAGNSGSLIVAVTSETRAAGIHYGGRRGELAENWGHVLGRVLDGPGDVLDTRDPAPSKSLRQCFTEFGVSLVG